MSRLDAVSSIETKTVHKNKKKTINNKNPRILILGDGDFSYTAGFVKEHPCLAQRIIATEYQSKSAVQEKLKDRGNLNRLKELEKKGVSIIFDVDASKMDRLILREERFEQIHFNFPDTGDNWHTGNLRRLLKSFFACAKQFQKEGDRIYIALPKSEDNNKNKYCKAYGHGVYEAARSSGYILIKKRKFTQADNNRIWTRYFGYRHIQTKRSYEAEITINSREYIFKNTSLSYHQILKKYPTSKYYVNNLPYMYRDEINTDDDSSSYEEKDFYKKEKKGKLKNKKPLKTSQFNFSGRSSDTINKKIDLDLKQEAKTKNFTHSSKHVKDDDSSSLEEKDSYEKGKKEKPQNKKLLQANQFNLFGTSSDTINKKIDLDLKQVAKTKNFECLNKYMKEEKDLQYLVKKIMSKEWLTLYMSPSYETDYVVPSIEAHGNIITIRNAHKHKNSANFKYDLNVDEKFNLNDVVWSNERSMDIKIKKIKNDSQYTWGKPVYSKKGKKNTRRPFRPIRITSAALPPSRRYRPNVDENIYTEGVISANWVGTKKRGLIHNHEQITLFVAKIKNAIPKHEKSECSLPHTKSKALC